MIKIKFNDETIFHDVTFIKDSDNLVTLKGDISENISGFTTWRMDGETQLGDFTLFNTVYRVLENGIQFSNDSSVYDESIENFEEPILEETSPTQLDLIEAQVMYTAIMTDTLLNEEE